MAVSEFKRRSPKKSVKPAPEQSYMMLSKSHFEIHGQLTLEDVLNITFTAQLRFMNQALFNVPEEKRPEAQGYFYDMFNKSASKLLEMFAPEIEMRPDLTADAILKAENEILDEFKAENPELPPIAPVLRPVLRPSAPPSESETAHDMEVRQLAFEEP